MTSTADVWLPALRGMHKEHRAIRLVRRIPGADRLDGFVVGLGRKWMLLARLPEARVDGFVAVRIRDIERFQVAPCDDLSRKLLKCGDAWPPVGPAGPIDLERTSELIRTAYTYAGLVNVQLEHVDPDIAFIGAPARESKGWLVLDELTPQAAWDGSTSRWRYRQITRVEFSGSYESDLLAVAGPMPTR